MCHARQTKLSIRRLSFSEMLYRTRSKFFQRGAFTSATTGFPFLPGPCIFCVESRRNLCQMQSEQMTLYGYYTERKRIKPLERQVRIKTLIAA
jgi:hypothetical protein